MTSTDMRTLNIAVERLLGDDLSCFDGKGQEREERIEKALGPYGGYPASRVPHTDLPAPENQYQPYWSRVWNNRDGQPWQADIEKHVADSRAEPRDFAGEKGDIAASVGLCMTVLLPKMHEACSEVTLRLHRHGTGAFIGQHDTWGDTPCLAIVEAFIWVMEGAG